MDLDAFEKRLNRTLPIMEKITAAWPELEEMLGVFAKMKAERAQYQAEREAEDQGLDGLEQGTSEPAQVDATTETPGTTDPVAPVGSAPSTENPAPPQS